MSKVYVIGAGLAGSEAAFQIAEAGIRVNLIEMKPQTFSAAHQSADFAELVCSNSLRSNQIENAVGLLKEELRLNNSLIIEVADITRVPAGGALAVDRNNFSRLITEKIRKHPLITIERREVKALSEFDLDKDFVIVASGPLTSSSLFNDLKKMLGADDLYFFDAIAPIVDAESIDRKKVFAASRYDKGEGEYLNCPFTEEEYESFYAELIKAKTTKVEAFDDIKLFQGCLPIESIAKQGKETLLYGPLKPVGLIDPKIGRQPYAVVQLRQDNQAGSLFNLVGFQTRLTFPEQKRVFSLIPGLEAAVFERFGVMHRNSFLNSPKHLNLGYQHNRLSNLYFAGQITGVEGYVESVGSGFVAAKSLINNYLNIKPEELPLYLHPETILGGLAHYVSLAETKNFQPMNANFGLVPGLDRSELKQIKNKYSLKAKGRRLRRQVYALRALSHYKDVKEETQNLNAQE
ncbi:MAG: methylenetetrahydrofolate--tRNA-(uracil(54)-C(5))-methyltransferase (FADH(2)-oxidizing) TrmFO [Clostridiaceae bacterium]|jgi:methylenetetrahydrofolate--tRNA-(uracil-5-)-methyltransferase|nr:methylenetetrahydrofolate--tRNA-(uracil(54)-C(5))-methyltransferase (FADH(2)-oxidizing) TrmFO [Clostridiaceae bacterium]